MMPPHRPLPFVSVFPDAETYVESLLSFVTSHDLFQRLCGGVHILDFLTQEPDLYSTVLPKEWRDWFERHHLSDILELLLHEDLSVLRDLMSGYFDWRDNPPPPPSLLEYIIAIRTHSLQRSYSRQDTATYSGSLPRHVAVGMKPKKVHEVENLSRYIADVSGFLSSFASQTITHVIDFGSGQNYLGRTLASPPYDMSVIALESKEHNITGARAMDITAKLADKEEFMRDKKQYRQSVGMQTLTSQSEYRPSTVEAVALDRGSTNVNMKRSNGPIHYFQTLIKDGNLSPVVESVHMDAVVDPKFMVVSLHSCGNLLHHGIRSLVSNPRVKAAVMVGCCYNLVTERLGPPTYKLPSLRLANDRLSQTSSVCDPHGFPMSERFTGYQHRCGKGVRMNITARMMACQAPQNWTKRDCESFFTKHFYRALLQRIFLEYGVVGKDAGSEASKGAGCPRDGTGTGSPLTIGSLRKACYQSFTAYARGAIKKISEDPHQGTRIADALQSLTTADIETYEAKYGYKKKELSIIWTLMAVSASVVESAIVTDRWFFLKEQPEVSVCWVEPVFDYAVSPRNLVIVGIKG